MGNEDELRQMIYSFRMSELTNLLSFSGRNKIGRKTDLQQRALTLVTLKSAIINTKIRKLHETLLRQLQQQSSSSLLTPPVAPAPSTQNPSPLSITTVPLAAMQNHNRGYAPYPSGHPVSRANAPMYGNNLYQPAHHPNVHQYPPPSRHIPPSQFPVHPDVKFKRLPFYDHINELIKPSSLVPQGNQRQQEGTFTFHLTPAQADMIGSSRDMRPPARVDYTTQVQLRFCLLETTSEQEDCFPPGVIVKVNSKVCQLPNPIPPNKPGVEPKRPPRPVNITPLVKISPVAGNSINVVWNTDYSRGYVVAVHLVNKKTSEDLLNRLKSKGVRAADYTRGMIKDKLKEDGEIATTSLRVSLACPLGKGRMTTPCRASTCNHFQCFDASLFLQMNEKKPQWMCPVCNKPAVYDKLVIDGYFMDVLESSLLPCDCNEIELNKTGMWSPFLTFKKEQSMILEKVETPVKAEPIKKEFVASTIVKTADKPQDDDVTIVTLSDSDDEPLMPRKKSAAEAPSIDPPPYHEAQKSVAAAPQHSPSLIILDEDSPQGSPTSVPPLAVPTYNTNGRPYIAPYLPAPHGMDINAVRYPY